MLPHFQGEAPQQFSGYVAIAWKLIKFYLTRPMWNETCQHQNVQEVFSFDAILTAPHCSLTDSYQSCVWRAMCSIIPFD